MPRQRFCLPYRDVAAVPQVYSAREVARATGVDVTHVEALMASGELPTVEGRYVGHAAAVAFGRRQRLAQGALLAGSAPAAWTPEPAASYQPRLFDAPTAAAREPALPAAVSAAAHLVIGAVVTLAATSGVDSATARHDYPLANPMRLVYLALPGPGGGGGGGGLRQVTPPPEATREGTRPLVSPLPEREPPPPVEPQKAEDPPPLPAETLPPLNVPIATSPSDDETQAGVLTESEASGTSRGPSANGGVGAGDGSGIGEGQGAGVGPGSGGGTGGGPFRAGSGITPPALLREVKPSYTEEARRRNIAGDVVLEIVVRADGTVGDVHVLDGLGSGLDQRAIEAVSQWRFSPARRLGQPVDVVVEVAVEFRLR